MAHTVTTAGLLNPDSASLGVTSPVSARLINTNSAIRSALNRSLMNNTTAKAKIIRVPAISCVNVIIPCANYIELSPTYTKQFHDWR